jgi:membrane peptidoglycan carboxypeptidase
MRTMTPSDIVRRRRARARQGDGRGPRLAHALAVAALLLALAAIFAPVVALAGGAAGLLAFVRDLPDVETLRDLPAVYAPSPAPTRLYAYAAPDAGGLRQPVLLDTIADPRAGGAGWLPLADVPPVVISATLAAVDPFYFDRPPLDLAAAAAEWARNGAVTQAQSPLTAELVAAHLRLEDPPLTPPGGRGIDATPPLTPPEGRGIGLPLPVGEGGGEGLTSRRDLQDWFLGRQIERRFGREQVLEWTLNTTYYGHLAYGIDAAARVYFGVGAAGLTAGQAALLVAVARDPAANPFDAPDAARAGQAAVLATMVQHGFLLPDDAADALAAPLDLAPLPGSDATAPAFARLARAELERLLGPARLVRGGYVVETTLDLAQQAAAECAVAAIVGPGGEVGGGPACPALDLPAGGEAQAAAVVALDAAGGAILALAADDLPARPTGTLVRPFIYLTALSQGYSAASLTTDVERIYLEDGRPIVPGDADGQYRGPLRLREALAGGRAAPAAQVLGWVGAPQVLDNAQALGVAVGEAAGGLAFADEGFSADLLSLAHAFAAVANGGVLAGAPGDAPRPATIARVVDARGDAVYAFAPQTRDALDPALAWLLSDMLAGGEPPAVVAGFSAAAGDAWGIAAAPGQVVGVWAGGATDADQPAAAARALLAAAPGEPAAWPPPPSALTAVDVCALSGLLPRRDGPGCPTVREWFAAGTAPVTTDTMTREVAVNRETGRLATILTPAHLIERRVYTLYPAEAAQWASEQGIPTPPAEYDTIRRVPARVGGAAVASPEAWAVVSGQWSVVGSAGGDGFSTYRLATFPGLLPEEMVVLVERGETVANGELGVWDTTLVDDGLYTLLLTVVRTDGTFDEVAIPVTVAN